MNGHRFNHRVEIFSTAILSLSENADFTIEISDLLIFLFAICMKICIINVKYFDGDYLVARDLSTADFGQ
jgi:hypothetical protein